MSIVRTAATAARAVRRYLAPRHPWIFLILVAGAALMALTTNWLSSFGIDVKLLGGSTPRTVPGGEAITLLLGLAGGALGVSDLSLWERTGSRSLRAGHVAWALGTLVLAIIPVALFPLGPVRADSPGLTDAEWLPSAYGQLAPYMLGVVTMTALGLIATTYLGRFLGPVVTLVFFVAVCLVQSLDLPALTYLPFPGKPQPPGTVVGPPLWALAVTAGVAVVVACALWRGRAVRWRAEQ